MRKILVLQSDFGIVDGAVSAMIGVALNVDTDLKIFDLSHSITPYNVYEASYRLFQSIQYWPTDTVFVSVVDPGVGSNRNSVVIKTKTQHYIVTPNNGSLTHIFHFIGIEAARIIDVKKHRRSELNQSYTFDGRDLYSFVGAKLASHQLDFDDLGPECDLGGIVTLPIPEAYLKEKTFYGGIEIFDERYGSIWTNLPVELFNQVQPKFNDTFEVCIYHKDNEVFKQTIHYGKTFNDVPVGALIIYINSLNRVSVAINQGNLSKTYQIETGLDWTISLTPCK